MPRPRPPHVALLRAIPLLMVLAVPQRLLAQFMTCVDPPSQFGNCTATVKQPDDQVVLRVKIVPPPSPSADGYPVTFTFKSLDGMHKVPSTTNSAGVAEATWKGGVESTVEVTASANVGGVALERRLVLRYAPYTLSPVRGRGFWTRRIPLLRAIEPDSLRPHHWYTERQFGFDHVVRINGATESDCERVLVAWKATGTGAVLRDTTRGRWMHFETTGSKPSNTKACFAQTRWQLGKEIGDQQLRAALEGGVAEPVRLRGRARALPRLVAGLAWTHAGGYDRLRTVDSTFRVISNTPTGQVQRDSVKQTKAFDRVDGQGVFSPVLAVDWPLIAGWPWLRTSVGASLKSATTDWFGGIAIEQLAYGVRHETADVMFHAIVHVSRREIVTNPGACMADAAACTTDRRVRPVGFGAMMVVGTGLLGAITTAFPLK